MGVNIITPTRVVIFTLEVIAAIVSIHISHINFTSMVVVGVT
ncbi:hypothetical protein [Litchfieldia alkalitelluris]|nr:hypothetical protein [Litchfieldia alkalitelluris]